MAEPALHSFSPSSYSSWQSCDKGVCKHSHDPVSEECDLGALCLVPLLPWEVVGGKNNTLMDGWILSGALQKAEHLLAVLTLVLWRVNG